MSVYCPLNVVVCVDVYLLAMRGGLAPSLQLWERLCFYGWSIRFRYSLIYLHFRFISPAVVAPETMDLDPSGDGLRRGLTLIAKIIQNLANNIFFGKEAHMMALNDFLRDHITHVTRYLSEINVGSPHLGSLSRC